MRAMHGTLFAIFVLALATPSRSAAQQYAPFAIGVEASQNRVTRDVATTQSLAGQILGARASLSYRRLQLEGQYAEGSLTPEGVPAGMPEELVDARLIARVQLLPWIAVGAGPHLRAFVAPGGTARWSRFEAHTRVEGELIAGVAQLRADVWYAVSADVNVQGGGNGALGGEVGLTVRVPRTPTAVQLSYVADRASFANGGTEFVEGIRIALVLDRILRSPASRTR